MKRIGPGRDPEPALCRLGPAGDRHRRVRRLGRDVAGRARAQGRLEVGLLRRPLPDGRTPARPVRLRRGARLRRPGRHRLRGRGRGADPARDVHGPAHGQPAPPGVASTTSWKTRSSPPTPARSARSSAPRPPACSCGATARPCPAPRAWTCPPSPPTRTAPKTSADASTEARARTPLRNASREPSRPAPSRRASRPRRPHGAPRRPARRHPRPGAARRS